MLLVGVGACASLHRGESSSDFCVAPGPGTQGPVAGLTDASGHAPPPASVSHRLAGTWDVLTVTNEGASPARADRWQLRLVPTDSTTWYRCPLGACRTRDVAVVAAGARVRRDVPFDSVARAQRRSRDPEQVEAHYEPATKQVTFWFGPLIFDAGTFYELDELTDSTFAGRWTDGSYAMLAVRRSGVTVFEHRQGYFCARR